MNQKMTPQLRENIYQYLIDNPACGRNDAARHFNVTPSTLQAHMKTYYGMDFRKRQSDIHKMRYAALKKHWPEIKAALDTEDCQLDRIAKRYGYGRESLRNLIADMGYDLRARVDRIRSKSHEGKPRSGKKVLIDTYRRESMAGYLSLKSHTLPMAEWGRLAA